MKLQTKLSTNLLINNYIKTIKTFNNSVFPEWLTGQRRTACNWSSSSKVSRHRIRTLNASTGPLGINTGFLPVQIPDRSERNYGELA
jgi:hypothetical protein